MKDVEDLQHRRMLGAGRSGEAVAKAGEVGPTIAAQADQLAVERQPALAEHACDRRQLGQVRRAVPAVARAQRDRPAVVAELHPAPIRFQLKTPSVATGDCARCEQHRRNERRLLLAVAHGQPE